MRKTLCGPVYSSSHDTCCSSCCKISRAKEPNKTVCLAALFIQPTKQQAPQEGVHAAENKVVPAHK